MKHETEPITEDEWLIRLVWKDRFTEHVPVISPNSFEPRSGRHPDSDGISLYRKDCLYDPEEALAAVEEKKRPSYGIVEVQVRLLVELGLSVKSSPADVPGHVVIPELNIGDYLQEKARFTPIKVRLAEMASQHILRRPVGVF